MGDVIRRMVWIAVIASGAAYATYLLAGSVANAQAASFAGPIVIRDELGPGVHHLSGMVMVPSSCYQLIVRTAVRSSATFNIAFTTWQDPSVECPDAQVPRQFHEVFFAPAAGVVFFATLDGVDLPIKVIPVIPTSRSRS